MDTNKAIELYGSPSALAKALGVTAGAVSQWITKGSVPPMRVYQLQVLRPEAFASNNYSSNNAPQ
ncbi:helix-turn-helix domain-containing protein [Deefgea piscis]|uniref:Helix-turn-helix domain-containing protein n=1 Tax=Deefgea piscis TaxID=2739061 RepID=A0A6M8T0D2_9NEIS|nr:Cro/CI family transcriptional regulator [Deefgea piscis]QKJ67467.1 helix-turn-helix domain-containing protein [Deefgea piscis]